MSRKITLRIISAVMLSLAAALVICALIYPQFDLTIHVGRYQFVPDELRGNYFIQAVYVIVMIGLFAASFFVKDNQTGR